MLAQLMSPPPNGAGYDVAEATSVLVDRVGATKSNADFLALLNKGAA
jgi:hypothetical protein